MLGKEARQGSVEKKKPREYYLTQMSRDETNVEEEIGRGLNEEGRPKQNRLGTKRKEDLSKIDWGSRGRKPGKTNCGGDFWKENRAEEGRPSRASLDNVK